MDSPSPPPVPDPFATAAAQGAENKDSARLNAVLNRPNQITPYGSLTWERGAPTRTFNQSRYDAAVKAAQEQSQGGGGGVGDAAAGMVLRDGLWYPAPATGGGGGGSGGGAMPDRNADQFYDMTPSDQATSRITLDPRVQELLDAQLATSKGLNTSVNHSLDQVNQMFSKPAPEANPEVRQHTEDALFQRYKRTLDPQFEQARERLRSQQMNRGMVEGSEGFNNLIDAFGRQENDAYDQARTSSIVGGGEEMQRQLQLEQAARMGVVNELGALRTGSQAQMPSFSSGMSGATVNPAPVAQSVYNSYQGQLGQYNADVGANNAMLGAAGQFGAALPFFLKAMG